MTKRTFSLGALAIMGILVALDAVCYHKLTRAWHGSDVLAESHHLITLVRDIHRCLAEAETGQRGFLLTGRESYLAPYNTARHDLDGMLKELEASSLGDTEEVRIIRRVSKLKMDELSETITLRRTKGAEAALLVVNTDRGRVDMEEIRLNVVKVKKKEEKRSEELYDNLSSALFLLSCLRGLQMLLAVILLGGSVTAYRRGM